jgi:hypothetical protein
VNAIPNGSLSPSANEPLVNEVVSWLRKDGRRLPPIEDSSALTGTANLAGMSFPCKVLSMQEKKITEPVFSWLRNNNPKNPVSVDDQSALADLAEISLPNGALFPQKKDNLSDDALAWMRNHTTHQS